MEDEDQTPAGNWEIWNLPLPCCVSCSRLLDLSGLLFPDFTKKGFAFHCVTGSF